CDGEKVVVRQERHVSEVVGKTIRPEIRGGRWEDSKGGEGEKGTLRVRYGQSIGDDQFKDRSTGPMAWALDIRVIKRSLVGLGDVGLNLLRGLGPFFQHPPLTLTNGTQVYEA
ncbi:hypothetical protein Salat_0841000, partial [Sesamum alatum]